MSFKKGFSKAVTSTAPKQGAGITLSGFSFKQLEEDDEEEDLTAFTGKYEKLVGESQNAHKKSHERTPSNSSVSSTSSAPGEIKSLEKVSSEGAAESTKTTLRPTSSLPVETSSPIRTAARAKFETSKELFSGLKGRITDKISRTIEEFSGDSSSSPSPEKETLKPLPEHRSNSSLGLVEKETVTVLHSSPSNIDNSSASGKDRTVQNELQDLFSSSSVRDSEINSSLKEVSLSVKEIPSVSPARGRAFSAPQKETISIFHSSGPVEDHPLANTEIDDDFVDVIEPSEVESFSKNKQGTGDDASEFFDPHGVEKATNILVFEEYFTSEPAEDFAGHPAFTTSTQLKPRSKIKRLIKKKEPKTSAVATMSGLHFTPDEEIATPFEVKHAKPSEEEERKNVKNEIKKDKSTPVTQESTSSTILRQFSLENRGLPFQKLFTVAVVLFAYFIVPLPSYISGFIMGTLLASLGWAMYMWLLQPPQLPGPVLLPPIVEDPLPVPEMKVTTEGKEFLYKGWMNELTDYNADEYHINKAHCVFVSLEGSHLRMQRPKNPVPKRAMWDEVLPKSQFIHQRHYDLPGSSVYLLPNGLVKKRIWSKKYPICIAVQNKLLAHEDVKIKHISSEPIMGAKKEKISDMGFEFVTEGKCEHNVLYLFARTGREKEEWFKRFAAAASAKPLGNHVLDMKRAVSQSLTTNKKGSESMPRHKREGSTESVGSSSSLIDIPSDLSIQKEGEPVDLLTFAHYMGRLMPSGSLTFAPSPTHTSTSKDIVKDSNSKETNKSSENKDLEDAKLLNPSGPIICDSQLFWINALIGRCFFDFLRDKWWISKVTEKLQRKLSKIHVPYFIEELQVTDINMGYEIPGIRHAGKPYIDERGFWIDLSITYSGGFQMTIETKMNLMKLKKTPHTSIHTGHSVDSSKSPITDSDEEDSAESSTDEEEEAPSNTDDSYPSMDKMNIKPPIEDLNKAIDSLALGKAPGSDRIPPDLIKRCLDTLLQHQVPSNNSSGGGASRKLFRYLNKITQSKYFQQATEYKVIKRAMENVSNTPLTLTVTVNSLVGKLALNIPPPPSDRLWYGFRGNPHLRLSAKPQVGERAVTITHVVEWIEKKLAIEFQRVFVMPNMDDLVIPILVPGEVSGVQLSHSISL